MGQNSPTKHELEALLVYARIDRDAARRRFLVAEAEVSRLQAEAVRLRAALAGLQEVVNRSRRPLLQWLREEFGTFFHGGLHRAE